MMTSAPGTMEGVNIHVTILMEVITATVLMDTY